MLRFRPLISILLLAALPAVAAAWASHGHKVVGEIAAMRLTPEAEALVRDLLGDESLADVANWADEVRPDRPASAPLHYVNFPTDQVAPTAADLVQTEGSVYLAVVGYAERVADESLPRKERVEALKFLVHFVGDVHQPLHCGFGHDRGGNDVLVTFLGKESNLHRVWDGAIIGPREELGVDGHAAMLLGRYPAYLIDGWQANMHPMHWVAESRAIVLDGLYPTDENGVLDETYAEENLPRAEIQLTRGGLRLAATLNAIAATGASPFEAPSVPFPPGDKDHFGPGELFPEADSSN